MSLTRRERRALRAIAGDLHAQDPALAELLSGPSAPGENVVVRRTAWVFVWVSASLLVLGLLLSDPGLLAAGGLLLMGFPPVVLVLGQLRDRDQGREQR